MPHPPYRIGVRKTFGGEDNGGVITHPLVHDELSRISEGSREGSSLASASYFSAASGTVASASLSGTPAAALAAAARDRQLGAARQQARQLHARQQQRQLQQADAAAATAAGTADAEELRRTVKAFVELGVRGRRLEALRRDGQAQAVTFRLSRQVDSFEVEPEGGRAFQQVDLTEVAAIYRGDDDRAQGELAVDRHCAVIDFWDSRCLALRFPDEIGEEAGSASAFVRCMQIFVQEVNRERATQPSRAAAKGAPEQHC